jgi:hypothetical protein
MTTFEAMVVNSGVDSLVVGFFVSKYHDQADFSILAKGKLTAGEKLFGGKGAAVTWFEKDFVVKASGSRGYEWILENGDVSVCIAQKAESGCVYPEVYVTFRAEYLWRLGYDKAFNEFLSWLSTWAVVNDNKVSRCDLCMDVQMPFPKIDPKRELIAKAKGKVQYIEVYANGYRGTGYKIGKGALVARIYDKSLEIKASQKEWFKDIWRFNGWDEKTPVIRVEFQARREFLKEMSVEGFESLSEYLADIWRYCTADWLTVRVPTGDSHRHRWPIAEWWKALQVEFILFGIPLGILRDKQPKVRYDHLMQQGKGVLLSAVAAASIQFGIDHGIYQLLKDLNAWFEAPDFRVHAAERLARMATLTAPEISHLVGAATRAGGQIEAIERGDENEKSLLVSSL